MIKLFSVLCNIHSYIKNIYSFFHCLRLLFGTQTYSMPRMSRKPSLFYGYLDYPGLWTGFDLITHLHICDLLTMLNFMLTFESNSCFCWILVQRLLYSSKYFLSSENWNKISSIKQSLEARIQCYRELHEVLTDMQGQKKTRTCCQDVFFFPFLLVE